jgi:predicted exporter
LLHLLGFLLIVAVGSNYALYFNARTAPTPTVLVSLFIANLTTLLGFGLLGFSSVPVLNALGSTVGLGAFLALVFSAMLAPKAT